jgi:hypothetical protein
MQELYPFKTVISSSWRKYCTKEQIEDLLITNGVNLPLHDDWCTVNFSSYGGLYSQTYRGCSRADEIKEWIVRNKPDDYIILDDGSSGASLDYDTVGEMLNESRIVMVNYDIGLGSYDLNDMFQIIKIWNKL